MMVLTETYAHFLHYCRRHSSCAGPARSAQGALIAKVDIELAYRLIPVHPHDRPLQAVQWDGAVC